MEGLVRVQMQQRYLFVICAFGSSQSWADPIG